MYWEEIDCQLSLIEKQINCQGSDKKFGVVWGKVY